MFLSKDNYGNETIDTRYDFLLTPDESEDNYSVSLLVPENIVAILIGLLLDGILSENWKPYGQMSTVSAAQAFAEMIAYIDLQNVGAFLELPGGDLLFHNGNFITIST